MFLIGGFASGVGIIMLLISLIAQPFVRVIAASTLAFGLVFLGLGFFVRRRSIAALITGTAILGLASIYLLVSVPNSIAASLFLMFLAVVLARGIKAMQALK